MNARKGIKTQRGRENNVKCPMCGSYNVTSQGYGLDPQEQVICNICGFAGPRSRFVEIPDDLADIDHDADGTPFGAIDDLFEPY